MMTLVLPLRGQHTLAFLQELVRESADGAKTPCFPFNCAQENMRAGTKTPAVYSHTGIASN
jgi:hypothetical protein